MVDYNDPATIAREFGARAFPSGLSGMQPDLPVGLFNSGGSEALAHRRWYIYVSLLVLPRYTSGSTQLFICNPLFLAGNSLLLFTTSGTCSEGSDPTDGRYGFVVVLGFITARWHRITKDWTLHARSTLLRA